MNTFFGLAARIGTYALLVAAAGISSPLRAAPLDISQTPLYLATAEAAPPLNMLVMGRDHKLYYEAYNDASDLNGDGVLDVGYKPTQIDYYGYFDSHRCYSYGSGKFTPGAAAPNKTCSGSWSGDFLNYLTTSRMDAMRKVLYGGYRSTDTRNSTVLERAYIPQDAHSWGKEWLSVANDGYDIRNYTPLTLPQEGRRHLFANTTLRNSEDSGPLLRVLTNSNYRIWNWVAKENPVAGTGCTGGDCATNGTRAAHPGHPRSKGAFDTMELTFAIPENQYGGVFTADRIDCNSSTNTCNRGDTDQNNYLTIITGSFRIKSGQGGNYRFRINGDDNIDFHLYDSTGAFVTSAGCYPDGRGFDGACGDVGSTNIALANNLPAGDYTFKFRMEEAEGGDGYRLEWERRSATNGNGNTNGTNFPWRVIRKLDSNGNNGDNADANNAGGLIADPQFRFYNLRPLTGRSVMTDYVVRVDACVSGALEANCKEYPNGGFKPTGILHDYGETDEMYFGLLTGSYAKNTQGGVLRRNLGSFSDEINANNGTFKTDVVGIVKTIDRQRTVDFNAYSYTCGWIANRPIAEGECAMWGNPIAEMMYETLRYFSGADTPRSEFAISGSAKDAQSPLSLPAPDWVPPYVAEDDGGSEYLRCATPVMTVISDINPSYDGQVPGSAFDGLNASADPEPMNTLDASEEVDTIWAREGGGSRRVFIGEAGGVADAAPTVKTVTNFSTVRGLAPEEPSKQGTYYSAGIAHFGANTPIGGDKEALTYAIAIASPLPTLRFPVGEEFITLVPFAKSPYGRYGGNVDPGDAFQPTNQIVDFFVQKIANVDPTGADLDMTVNGGRPYAEFRINYEDVEQGADHDMDAIVLYTLSVNADNKLDIALRSEYASGSIVQYIGYIISGTTKDGVYLEVSDCDTKRNTSYPATSFCNGNENPTGGVAFKLNTPPNRDAGYCEVAANLSSGRCTGLPYETTRQFTPGSNDAAGLLKDPLWYAAKYGRTSDIPWDGDGDGEPDNYFLVTNAGTLKEQLERAFAQIISDTRASAGVAASGTRRDAGFLAYVPVYDSSDWTGDLRAHRLIRNEGASNDGDLENPPVWNAAEKLGSRTTARNIFYVSDEDELEPFTYEGLGNSDAEVAATLGVPNNWAASLGTGMTFRRAVDYLRGDHAQEIRNGGPLRNRSKKLGDILGSQPTVLSTGSFGYSKIDPEGYASFLQFKRDRTPVVFVGANDGMLHAFDAGTTSTGGNELFAIVPNSVLPNVHELAENGYTHRFFVDGSPVQGDAKFGSTWKTILLAPMGAGGKSIVALDVTDPATSFDESNFLWEFTADDLGYTVGQPAIALLETGEWVALVPNGLNSASGRAYLYVLNLETGAQIAKIPLGTAGGADDQNGAVSVFAADAGVDPGDTQDIGGDTDDIGFSADLAGNSKADVIYAADYQGNVWRIGVQATMTPTKLFSAGRHITGGLNAAYHHIRGQMVFFGTGRYLLEGDNVIADDAEAEQFYGIWDENDGATVVSGDLVPQTFGANPEAIDWSESKGWSTALPETGEVFIGYPEVAMGRVLFTSFVPVGDECSPGGRNMLNVVGISTGVGALPPLPGATNPDGSPAPPRGREEVGSGGGPVLNPPVVTTPPEEIECNPEDEDCIPDPTCEEENAFDCDPPTRPSARECKTDLGVLLEDGITNFDSLSCGRQAWRQLQ